MSFSSQCEIKIGSRNRWVPLCHHMPQQAEGERVLEMTIQRMKAEFNGLFNRERDQMSACFSEAKEMFAKANEVVGRFREAADSPSLNRLVDANKDTKTELRDLRGRLGSAFCNLPHIPASPSSSGNLT